MIISSLQSTLTFCGRIACVGPQPAIEGQATVDTVWVRWRREDEPRAALRDLGPRPIEEAFDIPDATERDVGLVVEVVPYIAGDTQAFDFNKRQLVYLPSTHNDQRPRIFACGSATDKRIRIGVVNFNRYAVLRRVEISENENFDPVYETDYYYDWPGNRLPTRLPHEFLILRDETTGGGDIYVRVAHSHTLQSQLSTDGVFGGAPSYIYDHPPQLGPWSNVLHIVFPEEKTPTGIGTPGDQVSRRNDDTGLQTAVNMRVVHPGETEYVEISIEQTGLLDGEGEEKKVPRYKDEDSLEPTDIEITDDGRLTGLATPTSASDATTKAYVDALLHGLDWKQSVRVASTETMILSGLLTVDGVTLEDGDRVLVKDQENAQNNGIWIAHASGWDRAEDANADAEVTSGLAVFVEEGDENANTGWVLVTDGEIVVDTTELEFVQFTGGATPEPEPTDEYLGPHVATFNLIFGDGVSEITAAQYADLELPHAGEIIAVRLFADDEGSIEFDLRKDTYANFPPDSSDSIVAAAPPALSSAEKSEDVTLAGWTTQFTAGDVLRAVVTSAEDVKQVTLAITVRWFIKPVAFNVLLGDGVTELATGIAARLRVPFDAEITGVAILADQTGDLVVDIWRSSHSDAPPTEEDSITSETPPTLSAAIKMEDNELEGWTTEVDEGNWLIINVVSAEAITAATLAIEMVRR